MPNSKYINIRYPFQDGSTGFFLELNSDDNNAIKSDLMHLILTRKGQRLYNPDFGTDLLKFIFEPDDNLTLSNLQQEISKTVKKYLPNLSINYITVTPSPDSPFAAVVAISYTVTDNVFTSTDLITIQI